MNVAGETAKPEPHHLLKILGVTFGIAVTLGDVIGSGILRAPSSVASNVPDAAVIMGLWVLGAGQVALSANVYAELGAALPRAGGEYIYAQRAFGDIGGLIVGWASFLSNVAGAAAGSIVFAGFLPLLWPWATAHKLGVAMAVLAALFGANMAGLREGRALQETTSFVKAVMLVAFCAAAVLFVPDIPAVSSAFTAPKVVGWAGLVFAYQLIRGAYAGWQTPLAFGEEIVDPGRVLPRAMFIGIALTAAIYIAVNGALLYVLGVHGIASVALPFERVLAPFGPVAAALFALGALVTVASTANAGIMCAPRVLYGLAGVGLLPRLFERVNTGGSPIWGYVLSALVTVGLALTGSFDTVFALVGTLNGIGAILVCASLFVLRRREPDLPRPFRAVLYPLLPVLALAVEIAALAIYSASDTTGILFAAGLCGAAIPFALVARHGKLRTH